MGFSVILDNFLRNPWNVSPYIKTDSAGKRFNYPLSDAAQRSKLTSARQPPRWRGLLYAMDRDAGHSASIAAMQASTIKRRGFAILRVTVGGLTLVVLIAAAATRLIPSRGTGIEATPQQVYFRLHTDDELVAKP